MEWMIDVLGGAGGAALIGGVFMIVQWALNRKAQREDTATEQRAADCTARGNELRELNRKVDVLFVADRTLLYDRIKHLGKAYIQRGYVYVEELEDLEMMHGVYHDGDKLNGNGFLTELMQAVHCLEKRVK